MKHCSVLELYWNAIAKLHPSSSLWTIHLFDIAKSCHCFSIYIYPFFQLFVNLRTVIVFARAHLDCDGDWLCTKWSKIFAFLLERVHFLSWINILMVKCGAFKINDALFALEVPDTRSREIYKRIRKSNNSNVSAEFTIASTMKIL